MRLVPSILHFLHDAPEQRGAHWPATLCDHTCQLSRSSFSADARLRVPAYAQPPTFLYPHVAKNVTQRHSPVGAALSPACYSMDGPLSFHRLLF